MRYALLILFVAGCEPAGTNALNKEAAQHAADTMACAMSKRQICVCIFKDSWYTISGIAIDPTGTSCQ